MTTNDVKKGNFKINRTNKNLDRPRSERERHLTTCISTGVESNNGDNAKGMVFQVKPRPAHELWGRK